MSHNITSANPDLRPDALLEQIAAYVTGPDEASAEAYQTAHYCLLDALGCGMLALSYPECTKHLGPVVPGTIVPNGSRVPGTPYVLDPVKAAFDITCLVRWLDFNDTWLAAEWGHPSDNLGGILAVADHLSRIALARSQPPLLMRDVLSGLIRAYEVQGVLALANSFNRVGLDHVLLVKVASTAVVTALLGGTREEVRNAISQAWIDNGSLRTYRHAPNTGSRKSWAAGDATSRAVRLSMMTLTGEMGYPTALSAPKWGFQDVVFRGQPLVLERSLGSYVMEHVLFKVSFPAEFHAQTAVECALQLHPEVRDRLGAVQRVRITTHESAIRIIDKKGPLHNPADRDHCLQYMTAIGLIYGALTADHYEDEIAADPRIDELRSKMEVVENKEFSADYLDPAKRSIANTVQVFFEDGSETRPVTVEYPIGHRRRRGEAVPLLREKFVANLSARFSSKAATTLSGLFGAHEGLERMPVPDFMELWLS